MGGFRPRLPLWNLPGGPQKAYRASLRRLLRMSSFLRGYIWLHDNFCDSTQLSVQKQRIVKYISTYAVRFVTSVYFQQIFWITLQVMPKLTGAIHKIKLLFTLYIIFYKKCKNSSYVNCKNNFNELLFLSIYILLRVNFRYLGWYKNAFFQS